MPLLTTHQQTAASAPGAANGAAPTTRVVPVAADKVSALPAAQCAGTARIHPTPGPRAAATREWFGSALAMADVTAAS
ncbi:PE domain-containing protein [Mycobacterium shinjukuense]|uniref:PE domain-containing protein n=1 Tax=Mycobacterium shinjukuense TaxID=398694 RepID=A0A7I7MNR9_9MYCO|nr:PE domain-containing protein [Mycobacterium shinjukuense]BBX73482.1 hypothetical protein MSHI_13880 [Mycobacterium shinjukuense]